MAEPIKEKDEIQEATEVIETPVEEVVEKKEEAPVEETVETVETVETEATKEEVVTETKKMTDADSFITKMEGFICSSWF